MTSKYQDIGGHDLSVAEDSKEEFHDETLEDEIPAARPQQQQPASNVSTALNLLLSISLWALILALIVLLLTRILRAGDAPTVRI